MANTATAAEHRALDVYVGIDVFGRNTYGGGQFNSYKVFLLPKDAIKIIKPAFC